MTDYGYKPVKNLWETAVVYGRVLPVFPTFPAVNMHFAENQIAEMQIAEIDEMAFAQVLFR